MRIEKKSERFVHEDETLEDLQIKDYYLIQKKKGFRFGIDAVLLSGFAEIRREGTLMDLCSGTGVIALLADAKYPLTHIEGLEYQEMFAEMAKRSVMLNHLEERITIRQGDVKEIRQMYQAETFDYVTCNPPYMIASHGRSNKDDAMSIAKHEIACTLEDVIKAAAWILKGKGHLFLVHRPFRLAEIFVRLKTYGLEPKRMRLVHPSLRKEPNMVLIDAVKGGKERITVDPPFLVYNEDGSYTKELLEVYGKPI